MLFPWNVFITAASYFALRFANTAVESNFEQAFSFTYTAANLIVFLTILRYGATSTQFNLKAAVVYPNIITAVLFLLAAVFVLTPMDGGVLFAMTILSVMLCGSFAATLQAGIFGLTARLPPQYTQAVFGGQGAAGATVSLLSLVTLLLQDCATGKTFTHPTLEDIAAQSFGYFFASSTVVLLCLSIFIWLVKTDFVQHQLNVPDVLQSPALPSTESSSASSASSASFASSSPSTASRGFTKGASSWWMLVQELWQHCVGVCVTFVVTLAVFPGLASSIKSYNNPYDEQCPPTGIIYGFGAWQSFLFLIFNVGDTVGRQLILLHQVVPPKKVWMLAVGRCAFIPLFMTCNLRRSDDVLNGGDSSSGNNTSGVVAGGSGGSDFWPCLLMLLLALTNGYCGGLEMMNGPKACEKMEDQSRAGTMLAFFMTLGLLLGSLLAFPVQAIVD